MSARSCPTATRSRHHRAARSTVQKRLRPFNHRKIYVNPALFSTFASRFGPWFGRLVSSSPAILKSLIAKLSVSTSTIKASSTLRDVIAYAKSSPVSALLTMTTLASLGVSVMSLFGSDDEVEKLKVRLDPESNNFLLSLANIDRAAAPSAEAYATTVAAADESTHLKLGLAAQSMNNQTAIEILSFAKKFFGSPASALIAHRLLQAYMEMPHDDVVSGFETLRLS